MVDVTGPQRRIVELLQKRGDMRITIRETGDGLGIHNPTRRQMPLILFLLLWLGGWSFGEYFALSEIFRSGTPLAGNLFLIFWVTFWTLGGLLAWWFVLWQLFGVERLFITGGAVVHEIGLWRLRRRRVFAADAVRFENAANRPKMGNQFITGPIAYSTDGTERRFGMGMSAEEAEMALAAIRRHLPEEPASDDARPDEGPEPAGS
ncbi:MAG: hypothetical protein JJ913_01635 [Rhizobiaceae bacterium]|nr:hypothetical protein [Rhizobiaceae bacterium]